MSKTRELTTEQAHYCLELIMEEEMEKMGIRSLNDLTTMSDKFGKLQMYVSQRLFAGDLLTVANFLYPETE